MDLIVYKALFRKVLMDTYRCSHTWWLYPKSSTIPFTGNYEFSPLSFCSQKYVKWWHNRICNSICSYSAWGVHPQRLSPPMISQTSSRWGTRKVKIPSIGVGESHSSLWDTEDFKAKKKNNLTSDYDLQSQFVQSYWNDKYGDFFPFKIKVKKSSSLEIHLRLNQSYILFVSWVSKNLKT